MKLAYQMATISYCPDLTDPNALSVPISVLALAREDGRWSAVAVGLDAKQLGLDPLSSSLLADVPHLIRRHVESAMKGLAPDVAPAGVLRAFHESLKTSIHVSHIGEAQTLELSDPRKIGEALSEQALVVLQQSLTTLALMAATRAATATWQPRVPPQELIEPAPEQLFWRPTPPSMERASRSSRAPIFHA